MRGRHGGARTPCGPSHGESSSQRVSGAHGVTSPTWQFSSPRDKTGSERNGLYKGTRTEQPTETIYFADNEDGSWRPIFTATNILGSSELNDVWSPTDLPYPSTRPPHG